MRLQVLGESLELLPERALLWPAREALILGDVHLGKAESIQREGVAVPAESGASDLARLAGLCEKHQPKHVFILGDFIHQRSSWTPALRLALAEFFKKYSGATWNLILGNHERGSMRELEMLPLKIHVDDVRVEPFLFSHGHKNQDGSFRIEGHLHPIITLRDGPLRMSFPCFYLEENRLTLPAFGTWTGGAEVKPSFGERCFAVAPHEVFEVKTTA